MLALKSSLINQSDRGLLLQVTDAVIEEGGDGVSEVDRRGESSVLLSIPTLDGLWDKPVSASPVELDAQAAVALPVASSAVRVPLSIPEANLLQSFVQEARQRGIDLAGGSVFWRLFVGSGVAILMGAVTLILLGPSEDRMQDDETATVASTPHPIVKTPASQTEDSHAKTANARIQLTVSKAPHSGAAPADYDDPFTADNLVSAKVNQAIHLIDPSNAPEHTAIQSVSHSQTVLAQPAWLSGTIDIEDNAEPAPLQRKYERSRPSNR